MAEPAHNGGIENFDKFEKTFTNSEWWEIEWYSNKCKWKG
jgi:hypothetical protein